MPEINISKPQNLSDTLSLNDGDTIVVQCAGGNPVHIDVLLSGTVTRSSSGFLLIEGAQPPLTIDISGDTLWAWSSAGTGVLSYSITRGA